jgi:hypothetical protein
MKVEEFNNLEFKARLELIHYSALKIDTIIPWYGNLRIVTIYSLNDFFIELEYELESDELTKIYGFKSLEYLDKYPHHFFNIRNKVYEILKLD